MLGAYRMRRDYHGRRFGNRGAVFIGELNANNVDASLIHEAAIGKIAGEQLIKLMSLGLTEKEAEEKIVDGFLK